MVPGLQCPAGHLCTRDLSWQWLDRRSEVAAFRYISRATPIASGVPIGYEAAKNFYTSNQAVSAPSPLAVRYSHNSTSLERGKFRINSAPMGCRWGEAATPPAEPPPLAANSLAAPTNSPRAGKPPHPAVRLFGVLPRAQCRVPRHGPAKPAKESTGRVT